MEPQVPRKDQAMEDSTTSDQGPSPNPLAPVPSNQWDGQQVNAIWNRLQQAVQASFQVAKQSAEANTSLRAVIGDVWRYCAELDRDRWDHFQASKRISDQRNALVEDLHNAETAYIQSQRAFKKAREANVAAKSNAQNTDLAATTLANQNSSLRHDLEQAMDRIRTLEAALHGPNSTQERANSQEAIAVTSPVSMPCEFLDKLEGTLTIPDTPTHLPTLDEAPELLASHDEAMLTNLPSSAAKEGSPSSRTTPDRNKSQVLKPEGQAKIKRARKSRTGRKNQDLRIVCQ